MEWFVDRARGRWLQERIPQLGLMVPLGMEAYGRILHPAHESNADGDVRRVRWAEVAARSGRTVDSGTQWWDVAPDTSSGDAQYDGWWLQPPEDGRIEPELLRAYVPVLRAHTTTPDDITVGLWDGWGLSASATSLFFVGDDVGAADIDDVIEASKAAAVDEENRRRAATDPRLLRLQRSAGWATEELDRRLLDLPHRRYVLGATGLDALESADWPYSSGLGWVRGDQHGITPQLIWPADEAWCLSIEVDAPYTVVAGSRGLVAGLLRLPGVEGHGLRAPSTP